MNILNLESKAIMSAGAQSPLASSAAFERLAIVFALATPVLYIVCELANWQKPDTLAI